MPADVQWSSDAGSRGVVSPGAYAWVPSQLLDMLPLGVCICDRGGIIVNHNRAAALLLGRSPRVGESVDSFWKSLNGSVLATPDRRASVDGIAGTVLATGVALRDMELQIDRDGSRVVLRVDADPMLDAAGCIMGVVICLRDITDIRRQRSIVPESERHSRQVLEALPVAVCTTDTEGRLTYFNRQAVSFWGREPKLGEERWCGSHILRWPDGRMMPHDSCPMAVALREGRGIRGAEGIAERPDGSVIHFLAYPTPIWDESGRMIGATNTLVDITEQKRGEEAATYLAAIVSSSNDAIVSKDLDGTITSWNQGAEKLFGYSASEAVGKSITMLLPPDRQDEEVQILSRIRRGEPIEHFDTIRQRKDGARIEISLTVSPVKNAQGVTIGASKIARDVGERARSAERQTLLLREMSHRVKNLFQLASGLVTLSARFAQTPEEMAEAVRARLSALAQAHDLTLPNFALANTEQRERRSTIHTLMGVIAAPFNGILADGRDRISVHGPDVHVGGGAVTNFALLLHECATNAAKYGALSVATGHVDVEWTVAGDDLLLVWREEGGPRLGDQARPEGFGSMLARATVRQLAGSISRDWEADGLTIRLTLSLTRLAM